MSFVFQTSHSPKEWFIDTFDTVWYLAQDWSDVLSKSGEKSNRRCLFPLWYRNRGVNSSSIKWELEFTLFLSWFTGFTFKPQILYVIYRRKRIVYESEFKWGVYVERINQSALSWISFFIVFWQEQLHQWENGERMQFLHSFKKK